MEQNQQECDDITYNTFVTSFLANPTPLSIEIARKLSPTWPFHTAATPEVLKIGILDSSFNPPHYCHGAYIECMATMELSSLDTPTEKSLLNIDAFLLLLGSRNADKIGKAADPNLEQRLRMVDMLATTVALDTSAPDTWHVWKTQEQFDQTNLSNMAIAMVGSPRFVDKSRAVQELVQRDHGIKVLCYFAMGWDTLIRFFDRKYYDPKRYESEIRGFFDGGGRIVFSRRVGYQDREVEELFRQPEMQQYLQYIYEVELPQRVKHISSTGVRRAVRDSSEAAMDVPPRILGFVNMSQFYRDKI